LLKPKRKPEKGLNITRSWPRAEDWPGHFVEAVSCSRTAAIKIKNAFFILILITNLYKTGEEVG
jgi:hypothetical protein